MPGPHFARRGVYSARDDKRIRRTFATLAAARAWRAEAAAAVRRGEIRARPTPRLREAAEAWLKGARAGTVRTRSGDRYKPAALRAYESALWLRVPEDLGAARLSEITRGDLQALVDRLLAEGASASTIRNTVIPLRAISRRALNRDEVAANPTTGLECRPSAGGATGSRRPTRPRGSSAPCARTTALWATSLYAGLRRGELRALRIDDVDLAAGVIRVERSWDDKAGPIEPKSAAGRRSVPIAAVLREHLITHRLRLGRSEGLMSDRVASGPSRPRPSPAAR